MTVPSFPGPVRKECPNLGWQIWTRWACVALTVASYALWAAYLGLWACLAWGENGSPPGSTADQVAQLTLSGLACVAALCGLGALVLAVCRRKLLMAAVAALPTAVVCSGALAMGMVLARKVNYAKAARCMQDVAVLQEAISMYLADNEGAYPPAERWQQLVDPYVTTLTSRDTSGLRCPTARAGGSGYALNRELSALVRDRLDRVDETVVIFETDRNGSAFGGTKALPRRPRHQHGDVYAFADGSVRLVPREKAKGLIWQPVLKEPAEAGKREGEREDPRREQ